MKIDGSLARNIDFEVANFQVLRKTPRKTSILKLHEATKCENWRKSRTKCSFLMLPPVSSRVSGFLVASPCLWEKLQNVSFSNVSKQVVMSFCVAGVALCDIPTCLITCRKFQTWRKSRTKCWFFCIHVSCLESLVFLWRRRVYGGSRKMFPCRMCPNRLSCRFAWQAKHFVTFQPV